MKTIIYSLFFILLSISSIAQTPQAFKYQAVIRDGDGNIVSSQDVALRLTIHKAEIDLVAYQETHLATTNDYGIINLNVGYGVPVSGSFSSIAWGSGIYMLEVEVDPQGGTSYISLGMSSILSVPYALYAKTAGNGGGGQTYWEDNGNDDIFYWDGNVGIWTDTPEFKLTLDYDGGILAKGSLDEGASLTSTGSGSKMIWYPRKAAFRAGYQLGDVWNDDKIGKHSIALGSNVEASGEHSFAAGWNNVASGSSSIAMGTLSEATQQDGIAIGYRIETSGKYAMALGRYSSAENDYSATFGNNLKATADGAMVIGSGAGFFDPLQNSIANSLMIGFDESPTMMVNNYGVGIGTPSFNSNYKLQVKTTSGTFAIIGESTDQGGVYGYSGNNIGVYGFSSSGFGMKALTLSGTAFQAEHFGSGVTANLIGKATGNDDAVLLTENTNAGIAAKFITSGSSSAIVLNQGGIGPLMLGFNSQSEEEAFEVSGNGRIKMYNGERTQTIEIDPFDIGTDDGGIISLYNGNGTRTLSLDASETGATDGSQITLYNTYGAATIAIDGNHLNGEGRITTNVLEIKGGSDLAEPFNINSNQEILPGMVVSIDPDRAGQLRISDKAYDKCVAGIVSGAGEINTGLLLSQKGSITDGEFPVALTGRVYCLATTTNGRIKPGDLLTTSDLAGHVMKSLDMGKSQGAIVGKAMTGLDSESGLILVLVNLQ